VSVKIFPTCCIKAKFHYTGPTGPALTRADFFAKPGTQTRVSDKVRGLCLVGSGRAPVVEFSYKSVRTTRTTSPEQIEVMELEGFYCSTTYIKLVHSATTHSTVVGVIHKLTVDEFIHHTNRHQRLSGAKFPLSPKCINYSRHPDHAHLGDSESDHKANTSHGQPVQKI